MVEVAVWKLYLYKNTRILHSIIINFYFCWFVFILVCLRKFPFIYAGSNNQKKKKKRCIRSYIVALDVPGRKLDTDHAICKLFLLNCNESGIYCCSLGPSLSQEHQSPGGGLVTRSQVRQAKMWHKEQCYQPPVLDLNWGLYIVSIYSAVQTRSSTYSTF